MSPNLPDQHSNDERVAVVRRYTESAEAWLRKLVHDELSAHSGEEYITSGQWKKEIKSYVEKKVRESPEKYKREIDATTFDQIIDMVCNPNYWSRWSDGLKEAYPEGIGEARTFLQRIKSIRNDVSHGQICSSRQLEQAICYTNDLADSIKSYFGRKGLTREFNVPSFIRYYDNLGNSDYLKPGLVYRELHLSGEGKRALYPGDTLIAEVELDPSFDASDYDVFWVLKYQSFDRFPGTKATIRIENRHISEAMVLEFIVKTKLDWHRGPDCDDILDVYYKVLPPPS